MTNISKRILTSLLLLVIVYLSFINQIFLSIVLLFILYSIIFEFKYLISKINLIDNLKKYFLLLFLIIYSFSILLIIWISFLAHLDVIKLQLSFIIITCISSDVGGLIIGKVFKGKKLTHISPNKTYSGVFGSYFFSIFFLFLIFKNHYNINDIIILSILISTLSQIGDLMISFLKRKAKVKDTGLILPGHGGMLDRLDGYLIAIPFGLILFNIL